MGNVAPKTALPFKTVTKRNSLVSTSKAGIHTAAPERGVIRPAVQQAAIEFNRVKEKTAQELATRTVVPRKDITKRVRQARTSLSSNASRVSSMRVRHGKHAVLQQKRGSKLSGSLTCMALLGGSKLLFDMMTQQKVNPVSKATIGKKVEKLVEDGAVAVFDSKPVEKEWGGWLERAFGHTQTHNSLLYLLVNGISDNRFLKPAADYGQDLVEKAFGSKKVEKASSQMIQDVLVKEQRIAASAVNFCVWYARDSRAVDLASQIMCNVHLRSDVCDVMQWQCACAGFESAQTDEFRTATYWGGLNAITAPQVGENGLKAFVWNPMANTATFGLMYDRIYGSTSQD